MDNNKYVFEKIEVPINSDPINEKDLYPAIKDFLRRMLSQIFYDPSYRGALIMKTCKHPDYYLSNLIMQYLDQLYYDLCIEPTFLKMSYKVQNKPYGQVYAFAFYHL